MFGKSVISAMIVMCASMHANAQSTFKYGDEIAGNLQIVGPLRSSESPEIGAMAVFAMDGSFPNKDDTHMNAATSAACLVMREHILSAASKVEQHAYDLIAVQFRWATDQTNSNGQPLFRSFTGVYRAENCAPIT